MDLVLFTYDRPHWKTARYLHELVSLDLPPTLVAAAPWKTLGVPPGARTTVKHIPPDTKELCVRYDVEYRVVDHEWVPAADLGVIGGARILPIAAIRRFRMGVLNMHPGVIPENRGLSNMARAIRDGLPQVVTAHLVDERIDAGRVLATYPVDVEEDDGVLDIGEKLMDTQINNLGDALKRAMDGWVMCPDGYGYERPLPRDEEEDILGELPT